MTDGTLKDDVVSRFGEGATSDEVLAGADLTGKNAIVTGGSSGIGVETARALAVAGAAVMIAARDLTLGQEVADQINAEIGTNRVSVGQLVLDDLASVRRFAAQWGDRPLSLLINNAGVMACPEGKTRDGFETQFGTNHLGHFLLTELLVPALEKGAPARVVSLSSAAHMMSGIDFDDLDFTTRDYEPFKAYGQSKTANALFAVEFDRRYRDKGIRAFSVMPGIIKSNLGRFMTPELREKLGVGKKDSSGKKAFEFQSTKVGAATSLWAATAPELEGHGGLYLEDCAVAQPYTRDLPRGKGVMPHALDPETARRLWSVSEKLVGLRD